MHACYEIVIGRDAAEAEHMLCSVSLLPAIRCRTKLVSSIAESWTNPRYLDHLPDRYRNKKTWSLGGRPIGTVYVPPRVYLSTVYLPT